MPGATMVVVVGWRPLTQPIPKNPVGLETQCSSWVCDWHAGELELAAWSCRELM